MPVHLFNDGMREVLPRWLGVLGMLVLHVVLLVVFRGRFSHERELADVPALWLAGGMVSAGVVFVFGLLPLIRSGERLPLVKQTKLLILIVAGGALLRVLLLWSTPALEDDFYRYLWDGGVVASGTSPYAYPPDAVNAGSAPQHLQDLAEQAGYIHERINHPYLRTMYPPVAQAVFALAHQLEAWSLLAWRLVCIASEMATLGLLIVLLREVGRSPLWAATYWLNPLVLKEIVNSAHMEAVLLPLVLAALLLAIRQRHLLSITMVGLASGTKVWPVILAPLVLRPLLSRPALLTGALAWLGLLLGLMAWFPYQAGINETSGIVAYASRWQTNSAVFPAAEGMVQRLLGALSLDMNLASRITRAIFAAMIAGVALALAWRPWRHGLDMVQRATLIAAAMVLLSPAQFPWYLLWVQPLLAFRPIHGLWAATALMPIYYASFYFHARDTYWVFRDYIVWVIWIPILGLLAVEAWRARMPRQEATADHE